MRRPLFLLALCSLLSAPCLADPVSLFDGKTLTGWDFDPAIWRVEDGLITGGSTTEKIPKNFFISTQRSFQNFELKLKIKCSGDPKTGLINSGIQIRSIPDGSAMAGYQIDCGAGWFGKIYDEHRRNKVIWSPTPEQQAALDKAIDTFGWNEYTIRAEGPRIQTWINGVLCIDYTETDPNIALDGHIAPQVHSGGICLVQVKDVTIEELPPTPSSPTWKSIGGVEGMKAKLPAKPTANGKPNTNKPSRDTSYNNVQGTALSAQEQLKKFHLPEGYEIELVVQESEGLGKFVSVYFDQRGRLWTQTALEYPIDANENPAAAEAVYASKAKDKVLHFPREALNAPLPPEGLTNPTIFADGLAIPTGILPWGNGDTCYIQHGHDLKLYKDTNADGKADTFEILLTGFGVQDSHLFPHQFTRAPGGWIWMAQGLFNNSQVRKPGSDVIIDYPKCGMARMRPDGSEFEVTSVGPNNIWGLVITGEGETFIQEANDYGYPVMPFHEYAYYPGGMEALKKSYQPDFPPQAEFRMGGTGLSGLALIESGPLKDKEAAHTMAVANPITSKIQTLAMHRDGAYWKLAQLPDLVTCDDPFFRPVALTNGPDGCIYIVDWYNKIISHNEVPRAHPDRDKTRGRIWRIRSVVPALAGSPPPQGATPKQEIPDFTQLPPEDLIALLGKAPVAKAHLAWQTLADRMKPESEDARGVMFRSLFENGQSKNYSPAYEIQSAWALREGAYQTRYPTNTLDKKGNNNERVTEVILAADDHELDLPSFEKALELLSSAIEDPAPLVRFAAIQSLARMMPIFIHENLLDNEVELAAFGSKVQSTLISFAKPSLPNGPTAPSSRGNKQIPVREAYDREFERFLVRMFLERHPDLTAKFLDSEAATKLPIEARILASLALDPQTSASRVAKLLPQLDRAPNDEELLRLAQFPTEPGVAEALTALLTHETSRAAVAEKLLTHRTKLDPKQIAPLLTTTARQMLQRDADTPVRTLALQLISGFQLAALEPDLVALAKSQTTPQVIHALGQLHSAESTLFASLAESDPDPLTRAAAIEALAASRAPDAPAKLLALFPKLQPTQRKNALNTLSTTKTGAKTIVTALLDKSLPQSDLDGPTIERLATVLGNDPAIEKLQTQLGGHFQEVLLLDGQDTAWIDSQITLDGPFTVEAWVRLAPGIGNEDSLLGTPTGLQLNFFGSTFRAYAGPELNDVCVATKPMTPDLWTHLAVTRDAAGILRIYQNGELDATATKPAPAKWENCRIAWSGPAKGTEGAITEFRVWKTTRTPAEIRTTFDRTVGVKALADHSTAPQLPLAQSLSPTTLGKGARLAKTLDTPPLLTEAQALALDTQFTKLTALAAKGDPTAGKPFAALCIACHQIGSAGGQIGPNLSGVGAMGLEAILRNILTPNAAMEPGYRIYRVEMKNGDLIDAFFISEDKDAIVIRQPGTPDRRLPKAEVARTQFIRRSLMPEGLLDALPEKATADLLAYLLTLKG